jgi:putative oxidoreductase
MRFTAPASGRQLDVGLAVLRVVTGGVFAALGAEELFGSRPEGVAAVFAGLDGPLAGLVEPLVALLELVGGLALIAGLLTRPVALALVAAMLGALLILHPPIGFSLPDGYELVLALLGAGATLATTGAGGWSLDARIDARRTGATAPAP